MLSVCAGVLWTMENTGSSIIFILLQAGDVECMCWSALDVGENWELNNIHTVAGW